MTDATGKGMGAYVHVDEMGRAQPVTDKHATEWINTMLKEERRRELPSVEELLAMMLLELKTMRKHLERQEKREIEAIQDLRRVLQEDDEPKNIPTPVQVPHQDLWDQLRKLGINVQVVPKVRPEMRVAR